MGNSMAYEDAITAHNHALAIFNPIRNAYREGKIEDSEFLTARTKMTEADTIFDAAFADEKEKG